MSEKSICLSGGELYTTKESDKAFVVEEGVVIVYIVPEAENEKGRRLFLYEAGEGEQIPAFSCRDFLDIKEDKLYDWHFAFAALENARIVGLDCENLDEIREGFSKRAGLKYFDIIGFEESVLEFYRLEYIRSLRTIYATAQEQKKSYAQGLGTIYGFFKEHENSLQRVNLTGNLLYDACSVACERLDIKMASIESVKESAGAGFTMEDIARVSHFSCRKVILENDWYKQDCGVVICFTEEGKPFACIPKGASSYVAADGESGEVIKVDGKFANGLSPKAWVIYKPLLGDKISFKQLMKTGFSYVYKSDIARFVILAFLGTILGLLIPYINEQIYDLFIPLGDSTGVVQVCSVLLACIIGNISFAIVKNLAQFRGMNAMKLNLQCAVFDRLYNMPQSYFRRNDSAIAALSSLCVTDIFENMSQSIVATSVAALFSLLYVWRMFMYSAEMAWISILMVLLGMLVIVLIGRRQVRYEKERIFMEGKISSLLYQQISGVSKIRTAGVEERALYKYMQPYTESRKLDMKASALAEWADIVITALPTVFSMVLYYVMVKNSLNLTVGQFVGFTSAFSVFALAMLNLAKSILSVNNIIPSWNLMKDLLNTPPEVRENTDMPGEITGDIELSHVSFSYDEKMGRVINDVSLHIKEGEYVGIVGSSGCGKSTMLRLLLGFEKPDSGKIYYDGKDIDGIDKRELRKKFGVVLQGGSLVPGSIAENITIANPGITQERIWEVIRQVGLEEDIKNMPMGLHTLVSETGGTISGGQKQRILIARALVNNPQILFLDEATSALDNLNQAMVIDSLEKVGCTRLVIAHRLSTVINCDRILVMDGGKIVEQGTYDQLMDMKGLFYDLANRQIA